MIYKIEVYLEVAKPMDIGKYAVERLIDDLLKEALPEAFLVRDVAVEEQ